MSQGALNATVTIHETGTGKMESQPEGLTVLVVDDDLDLRSTVRALLEHDGFAVLEAGGADAAQRLVETTDQHIDVVLMDINLPDGWGATVAHRLRSLRPDMATVFATGFAPGDPILASGLKHVDFRLHKPFTRAKLVQTLRDAVAAHRT